LSLVSGVIVPRIGRHHKPRGRLPMNDPTNAAAAETPFTRPPIYEPDPLLSPVPPPQGNPPMREAPGGGAPPPRTHHEVVDTTGLATIRAWISGL
jgi:hypothetical protein